LAVTEERAARSASPREGLALGLLGPAPELQPGDRPPAPGALALVQAFVNTFWDLERGQPEVLATPSALARWLSDHRLLEPGTQLVPADLAGPVAA